MPIYEYQCDACGKRLEVRRRFSDKPLKECPHCGKKKLRKLMSAPSFQLKGTGWYVTDFKDKKPQKKEKEKEKEKEKDKDKTKPKEDKPTEKTEAKSSEKETAKSTDAGEKKSTEKKSKPASED